MPKNTRNHIYNQDINLNKIELSVSNDIIQTLESIFWIFQKLPKHILLSSSTNKFTIHNTKLNKTLRLTGPK